MNFETTRREMLKGAGISAGALVLGPVLNQLAAHAAGDEAAARRLRVVFFMQSNGMKPDHLVPQEIERKTGKLGAQHDGVLELPLADKKLHKALEPLEPFKHRLGLIQGLSGRIAYSDHSCNFGALGCYPANVGPMNQTIDLALAEALPSVFNHVGLGVSNGGGTTYAYSAVGPGQAAPNICSPAQAYKMLFGSVADGNGQKQFHRRTNLLDFMADDVRRVSQSVAGPEREKLDRYLQSFESLHNRQGKILAMRKAIEKNAPPLGDKLNTTVTSEALEVQVQIAGAALIAGLTNVVTIVTGEGSQRFGSFPEFGIPGLHHIGHGKGYGEKTAEDCFVELRRFCTGLIARLAKKLDSVPEGDGTMLDNTLIVYLSDSADGHHPGCRQWPVVLLGNLAGKLKTEGRYIDFPQYQADRHRTMSNLYCTLLHAAGTPRDTFGVHDPALADLDQSGPLAELWA